MRRKVLACFTGCFTNRSASATEYYDPSDKGSWSTNRYMPATTAYILLHTTTQSLGRAAPMPAGSDGTGGVPEPGKPQGSRKTLQEPTARTTAAGGTWARPGATAGKPPSPAMYKRSPWQCQQTGANGAWHVSNGAAQQFVWQLTPEGCAGRVMKPCQLDQ